MMNGEHFLCRDILGKVHIIAKDDLLQRQSVYGIIFLENNLVVVRSPGQKDWDLPGGGIEASETNYTALSREVREETGLLLKTKPKLKCICRFKEYFFDITTHTGWESQRSFYKIECRGKLNIKGEDCEVRLLSIEQYHLLSPTAQAVLSL